MTVTAESLFRAFFLPLYPEDARADLSRARATDANPAGSSAILGHLDEAASVFEAAAGRMFDADVLLDRTDASIHRLSRAITPERRDAWARSGAPGSADSELFNVVVHGSAYVGACIVLRHGGAWSVRSPLWESKVRLESRAGIADLAPFHWWLKALADDALGEGAAYRLADRYRGLVEIPCATPESLPVLAAGDRKIPRLAKVHYHNLHQHLRAHVPELKDLGQDFPSAERFTGYDFKWLDFVLLGAGRMLLMHGPGKGGVHLFWIGASGFEKAAHVPADAFPAHVLKVEGDKLVLVVSVLGKQAVHEMLWWGP